MPLEAPRFWSAKPGTSGLAKALRPLGILYHREVQRRLAKPAYKASVPVICVGNATMGGVGKTPLVMALGEALKARGHKPHILSRGYGGSVVGPVRVEDQSAGEVGDEPLLLSRVLPVWVSRDRAAGAEAMTRAGAGLILMDDGLQNPSLRKDISIMLVDTETLFGNGEVFPAGPLRERPEATLARSNAVVTVGGPAPRALKRFVGDKPLFAARFVLDAGSLPEGPIAAACGIGRPERFLRSLQEAGADVVDWRSFPDHYPFSQADIEGLKERAARLGAKLVVTEKDFMRLPLDARSDIQPAVGRMEVPGLDELLSLMEERL